MLSAMVGLDQYQHALIKTRLGLFVMAVATTNQPAVKQAKLPTVPTGKKKSMNDLKKIQGDSQEAPRPSGPTALPA